MVALNIQKLNSHRVTPRNHNIINTRTMKITLERERTESHEHTIVFRRSLVDFRRVPKIPNGNEKIGNTLIWKAKEEFPKTKHCFSLEFCDCQGSCLQM